MNKERLLNVARALRESPHPEMFSMERYVNDRFSYTLPDDLAFDELPEGWCGTPACALGHYAARTDLQAALVITKYAAGRFYLVSTEYGRAVGFDSELVLEHFDIDHSQAVKLFDCDGCARAQTPIEAAEYIENFVAERE